MIIVFFWRHRILQAAFRRENQPKPRQGQGFGSLSTESVDKFVGIVRGYKRKSRRIKLLLPLLNF
jgi:hypothetical protein